MLVEGAVRPVGRGLNGATDAARFHVTYGSQLPAFAPTPPGFLQGVLEQRQYRLVGSGVVQDLVHQQRRIERQTHLLRWRDDSGAQVISRHRADVHLLPGHQGAESGVGHERAVEVRADRKDDARARPLVRRERQDERDEPIHVARVLVFCLVVAGPRGIEFLPLIDV